MKSSQKNKSDDEVPLYVRVLLNLFIGLIVFFMMDKNIMFGIIMIIILRLITKKQKTNINTTNLSSVKIILIQGVCKKNRESYLYIDTDGKRTLLNDDIVICKNLKNENILISKNRYKSSLFFYYPEKINYLELKPINLKKIKKEMNISANEITNKEIISFLSRRIKKHHNGMIKINDKDFRYIMYKCC